MCLCIPVLSGLPPGGDVEAMKVVWQNSQHLSPKPITVLAALLRCPEEVEKMDIRLKMSREEKSLGLFLVKHRRDLCWREKQPDALRPFTDFIIDVSLCICHSSQNTPPFIFSCLLKDSGYVKLY